MFFHNFERISLFPQVTKYSARNFFFIYSVQELDFVILVVLVLFIFGLWFKFWFTWLKLDILSYFTSLVSFWVNDWHHESRSLIVPPFVEQNCISHTRKLEPIVNILVDSLTHIDQLVYRHFISLVLFWEVITRVISTCFVEELTANSIYF